MKYFSGYTEFLNESVLPTFGKNLSFRDVSGMIRKKFPGVNFKVFSRKRAYYSPHEEEMEIFSLGKYPSRWVDVPSKDIKVENDRDNKLTIEIAKFLQSNKITAWTNAKEFTNSAGRGGYEIHVIDSEGLKQVKKLEKLLAKEEADAQAARARREQNDIEARESMKKFIPLADKLKQVPFGVKFTVPGVGDIALSSLSNGQVMWSTWGSFKVHDGNSKKDVEELAKIVDYIYNESPLKTKLMAKKYGI